MKIELSSLPFGLCSECLERLRNADEHEGLQLQDGTKFVHAYCEHREAGALAIVRPGAPLRWKIDVPVDVLAWERGLEMRMAAVQAAKHLVGPAPQDQSPGEKTH